jgi:hypothetical protein
MGLSDAEKPKASRYVDFDALCTDGERRAFRMELAKLPNAPEYALPTPDADKE